MWGQRLGNHFKQNEKRNGGLYMTRMHTYETTILKIDLKFHKSVKTKKFSSYITFGKE